MPTSITKPKLLIGEGKEEVLFFESILVCLGIRDIQVDEYKGKASLQSYLDGLRASVGFSGLEVIAITRDNDDNPHGAECSVKDAYAHAFQSTQAFRIELFFAPAAGECGALEDLVVKSLCEDPSSTCVDRFLQCLADNAIDLPKGQRSKAWMHTWLASRKPPDLRLGEAARKGLLNFENPAFSELRSFLKGL